MKIIGWGHYDYDNMDKPLSEATQRVYREIDDPNPQETYMNLCDEIRKHGYKFDGPYHQDGAMGCPIAEDGSYITHSYRSWGQVMADAWSCVDKVGYCYMDFYMMDNYSDEFKTPEYELPGFVKPERPIVRKPPTHLIDLTLGVCFTRLKKSVAEFHELYGKLMFREVEVLGLDKVLKAVNEIKDEARRYEETLMERNGIIEDFYRTNPQFNPKEIVTLKSKDGLKSVRVYGNYAGETYESVMEKYPVETCTDNQLETVFPDWNRFERTFDGDRKD